MTVTEQPLQPDATELVVAAEAARDEGVSAAPGGLRQRTSWAGKVARGAAAGWLGLMILLAIIAPWLPLADVGLPVDAPFQRVGARWPEFLGTDQLGRSLLARTIVGSRQSLVVGFASVAVALVIGGALGIVAGYRRGRIERVIGTVVDATLAYPPLMLLLAISAMLQPSLSTLVFALGVLFTPTFARLARANTLRLASQEYILAARAAGAGHVRIMFKELLPSVLVPLCSYSFLVVAAAIVAEGSLSFLGMGIPAPTPSWGGMVAAGRDHMDAAPHVVLVPAVALLLTVMALNAVGDRLRRRVEDDS